MSAQHSPNVHVSSHPCIQEALWHLRNTKTTVAAFRQHSNTITSLLISDALKSLEQKPQKVQTPLKVTTEHRLSSDLVVVPVLRAGLAMLFGVLDLVPETTVGFVGLERNEETAVAREYYWKLPKISHNSTVLVVDPMLATGGSALHVLRRLAPTSPKKLQLVCVIAAPEGIAAVQSEFPEVEIVTAAVDEGLNDLAYIVPGLGDYGDRYFGTV